MYVNSIGLFKYFLYKDVSRLRRTAEIFAYLLRR